MTVVAEGDVFSTCISIFVCRVSNPVLIDMEPCGHDATRGGRKLRASSASACREHSTQLDDPERYQVHARRHV